MCWQLAYKCRRQAQSPEVACTVEWRCAWQSREHGLTGKATAKAQEPHCPVLPLPQQLDAAACVLLLTPALLCLTLSHQLLRGGPQAHAAIQASGGQHMGGAVGAAQLAGGPLQAGDLRWAMWWRWWLDDGKAQAAGFSHCGGLQEMPACPAADCCGSCSSLKRTARRHARVSQYLTDTRSTQGP